MSTSANLIRSSASRVLHAVAVTVVGFFMMPFLVRSLGEYWYGIWALLAGLAGNYYLLDIGLAAAVTRFVSRYVAEKDDEQVNVVINTSLVVYSGLATVVMALAAATAWLAPSFVSRAGDVRTVQLAIVITGAQFAGEFPFKAFAGVMATYLRHDLLIYSRLLNLGLSTALTIVLVRRGFGILALAVSGLACNVLSNVIYYYVARHLFRPLRLRAGFVRRTAMRELFGFSGWAFVIQLANQVRFRMDGAVIGARLSAAAITHYTVPLRLVEYFVDLIYRATNMMTPLFTRYFVRGEFEEIRSKLLLLTRINAILAVFGGGVIVMVGRSFIVRWMGEPFAAVYPVLVVLMAGMIVEVIGCYADNLFYAMARHRDLAIINVVEGGVNLALSIALAVPLGLVGVAAGTAIPLIAVRLVVIPRLVSGYVGLRVRTYYASLAPVVLFSAAYVGGYAWLTAGWLDGATFPAVALRAAGAVPLYALLAPLVAFSRAERAYLWRQLGVGRLLGRGGPA